MEEKSKIEQIDEEYYAAVVWKDIDGKHHIVGTLAYFDGKYYFKYEQTSLKEARGKNFNDVASFNDDKKLYISEHSLFSYFKTKVSPGVKEIPAAMAELIETRGKSTNDDISIIPFPKTYQLALKAEIQGMERAQKEDEEEKSKKQDDDSRDD